MKLKVLTDFYVILIITCIARVGLAVVNIGIFYCIFMWDMPTKQVAILAVSISVYCLITGVLAMHKCEK